MAYTVAQVESKIETLESHLTSGVKSTQWGDRALTRRDIAEITDQIQYWRSILRTLGTRSRVFHVTGDKGFGPDEAEV